MKKFVFPENGILITGKYQISMEAISQATLIAISSNNILKLAYALLLGSKSIRKPLIIGFSFIIAVTVVLIFVF